MPLFLPMPPAVARASHAGCPPTTATIFLLVPSPPTLPGNLFNFASARDDLEIFLSLAFDLAHASTSDGAHHQSP
jgi:hypothetical protein